MRLPNSSYHMFLFFLPYFCIELVKQTNKYSFVSFQKTRHMTETMPGVFSVFVLIIFAISRGGAIDTTTTSSVGSKSTPLVQEALCNCNRIVMISYGCYCPDLYALNSMVGSFVSRYLSAAPEITEFDVLCKQSSPTNASGLFDFLPASIKQLSLLNCFRKYIGKEVFYGIPNVEDLAVQNLPLSTQSTLSVISNFSAFYSYVFDNSSQPLELDPEVFLSLPQLQKLSLLGIPFFDRFPKALYQEVNGTYPLPNLKSLDLRADHIPYIRPEYLQHLTKLRSLDIAFNRIANVSTSFPFLPGLQMLKMPFNRIHSLVGSPFKNLSNLQSLELNLQYSYEKDSSEYGASILTNIDLVAMEFIFPTSFLGLSKLKSLQLAMSKIRSIPNGTFRELVQLEQLDISGGLIDHIGASAFQGLSALESLDLSNNNLSTIHPLVFSSLSSLLYLYLQNNSLQSLSPTTFENIPYLLDLNLGNNLLTTITRELISPLLSLRTLNVHGNQLETVEEIFSGITSDFCDKIDASFNKIESLDISSLRNLGVRGKTVNVDLSHNNLHEVYLSFRRDYERSIDLSLSLDLRWNQFTSLPLGRATYWLLNRSKISIRDISGEISGDIFLKMTHNPLLCDCELYELIMNLDVAKHGVYFTKTDFKDMECRYPDTLSGRRVVDLRPSELWCSEQCYNRPNYCTCYEHAGQLVKTTTDRCMLERINCPSECSCLFQGKLHSSTAPYNELVNCAGGNLTSIPYDISNVTTILHLEGNQLRFISQTVLPQLLMIRELYLHDNNISYVGAMAFSAFNSLEILRLDGNNISEMDSTVFKSLSNLRELYLNHSGVRYLEVDTFHDLESLQELYLEKNKLQSLPNNMFAGLKKLRSLSIHGNPLNCDCHVLWVANWLRSRPFLLPKEQNVTCLSNTKIKRDIFSLSSSKLDCDDLRAAQARNRLTVGVSVPLVLVIIVLVCVIVVFKRKKDIQVYLYARYGWRFREEEEDEDKEYDAFLSYSQHDLDVVLHDVLPALENREPPFRVCLHHRDFLPGVPIAENILNAVSASKRTIILLSNNFLESDWCQLEFQAAHAQMLQDRANRVIVVLLDDVPAEDVPPDIQHYLKTNTYLKWGDERFWERLIYVMPRPRPHAQDEDGDQLAMVELDHNR
ncbi:uncharacterized protein LOC144864974 [Branchiostoma floridae x Branchiostoma japonicum]